MVKRVFLIILSILAITSVGHCAESTDWLSRHQKKLMDAFERKNCDKIWNILWPEAKAGNLQARAVLAFYVMPLPDIDRIIIPGHSNDFLTFWRDGVILNVHSSGVRIDHENGNLNYMDKMLKEDKSVFASSKYIKCKDAENSAHCSDVAVEEKLVPSFANYADEIDRLISTGAKPTCEFMPEEAVDTSGTGGAKK